MLILAEILLNAIVKASVDYWHINDNYFPDVKQSFRNDIIERKAEEQRISLTNEAIDNMYSVNLNLKKPIYTDINRIKHLHRFKDNSNPSITEDNIN